MYACGLSLVDANVHIYKEVCHALYGIVFHFVDKWISE